ncbi:hypothetical protein [Pelagerythrobacter aerophilus]|uniref:Uncharacterized protein n=1 Tax=Pelagerythrobacter aerophilus TaxID=2306995 RepID=A0A418NLX3_9SPHN|nr:hypothetical protein [Pelagerythrobacter aerophilus]RIV81242.1 hypothetical protein D2V04_01115 [Pelagerythrobacter aerophilus]
MASKRSSTADGWTGRRLDMPEFARQLAARKAALGLPDPPRNAGKSRTASKRALLRAIEESGGEW